MNMVSGVVGQCQATSWEKYGKRNCNFLMFHANVVLWFLLCRQELPAPSDISHGTILITRKNPSYPIPMMCVIAFKNAKNARHLVFGIPRKKLFRFLYRTRDSTAATSRFACDATHVLQLVHTDCSLPPPCDLHLRGGHLNTSCAVAACKFFEIWCGHTSTWKSWKIWLPNISSVQWNETFIFVLIFIIMLLMTFPGRTRTVAGHNHDNTHHDGNLAATDGHHH